MINSFPKQQGAATLILTVLLFILSSLIILFAANYGIMQSKSEANYLRYQQAFEAAEAGLEFGINYLNENKTTVLAGPVSGFIAPYSDGNTTNVTLANNSSFTVVYTNPIANNYELITVTSTGTSADGSAVRTVTQEVQEGSLLVNPPTIPLTSKAAINMDGNAQVINTEGGTTMESAASVTLGGSSSTVLNSGTSSTASLTGPDIEENSSTLNNLSQEDFFASIFGADTTLVQGSFEHYYNNSSDTNYKSLLDGMTGTSIWIDQTAGVASINGNTNIGTASSPVLVVVNGNFSLSGNVTIYGFIFVMGTNDITSFTGNTEIIGSLVTTDTLNMTGSIELSYSSPVIINLQNLPILSYFAKVPGTWRDY